MTLHRKDLPAPLKVAAIDLNGHAAYAGVGEPFRTNQMRAITSTPIDPIHAPSPYEPVASALPAYPGLIPIPDNAVNWSDEPLTLQPWQRELWLHAELVMLVGRDVAAGEGDAATDAVLGYALGLGLWDNAAAADLQRGIVRDFGMAVIHGYYQERSRRQGAVVYTPTELPPLHALTLTLHVPGYEPLAFPQSELLNDGPAVLREVSRLLPLHRGDVICLGPARPPLVIPAAARLPAGSKIRVTVPPCAPLVVAVDDRRDPAAQAQPWPGRKP